MPNQAALKSEKQIKISLEQLQKPYKRQDRKVNKQRNNIVRFLSATCRNNIVRLLV